MEEKKGLSQIAWLASIFIFALILKNSQGIEQTQGERQLLNNRDTNLRELEARTAAMPQDAADQLKQIKEYLKGVSENPSDRNPASDSKIDSPRP